MLMHSPRDPRRHQVPSGFGLIRNILGRLVTQPQQTVNSLREHMNRPSTKTGREFAVPPRQ
jgi:hypothetical protein